MVVGSLFSFFLNGNGLNFEEISVELYNILITFSILILEGDLWNNT